MLVCTHIILHIPFLYYMFPWLLTSNEGSRRGGALQRQKKWYIYTYFKLYFCYFLISSKYIFDFSVYARLSCVFTNALEYSLIFGLWLNSILLGWLHSYKTMTKVWCELCYCITKYQSIHDRFSNQSILFFGLSRSI